MIYKTTSVERVIGKVFQDLDLKEGDHRLSDIIEWAGEALEKIGAFPSFISKVTGKDDVPLLEVINYQVKLPADFYSLVQAVFSTNQQGPYYPMRYGSGNFDTGNPQIDTLEGPIAGEAGIASTSDLVLLTQTLYNLDYEDALAKLNSEPDTRSKLSAILTLQTPTLPGVNNPMATTRDITYVLTPGYIKMNVESGYIMLA
jgi:hypothetical protein